MRYIFIFLLFLIPSVSFADQTITTGTFACVTQNFRINDTSSNLKQGQQFQVSQAGTITSFSIVTIAYQGSPSDDVIVNFYADSANEPSGASLGSHTFTNPTSGVTLTYNPNLTVASSTYWWVVTRTTADASNYRRLCGINSNYYLLGQNKTHNGSVWGSDWAQDLSSEIVVTSVYSSSSGGTSTISSMHLDTYKGVYFAVGVAMGLYFLVFVFRYLLKGRKTIYKF